MTGPIYAPRIHRQAAHTSRDCSSFLVTLSGHSLGHVPHAIARSSTTGPGQTCPEERQATSLTVGAGPPKSPGGRNALATGVDEEHRPSITPEMEYRLTIFNCGVTSGDGWLAVLGRAGRAWQSRRRSYQRSQVRARRVGHPGLAGCGGVHTQAVVVVTARNPRRRKMGALS